MKSLLLLFITAMIFMEYSFADTTAEYIKFNAQEFKNTDIPLSLVNAVEDKKLIMFGEQHGTNEIPDFTFKFVEIMAQNYTIAFGLEFPIDIQQKIDQFLKTGDEKTLSQLEFFKNSNFHSGRGSEAMVRLLKHLRSLQKVKVFCFDIPMSPTNDNSISQDRDTKMAENILKFIKLNPHLKVITFSGNLHSRLVVGTPWDPNTKNMGSEILRLSKRLITLKNSSNVLFRADEGVAWQCQSDSSKQIICKDYSFGPINSIYRTSVPFDRYFLQEPQTTDGHINSVFIKTLSASPPWKTGT